MQSNVNQLHGGAPVKRRPGKVSPRAPALAELKKLLAPFSTARQELSKHYVTLAQYTPAPLPYVIWHLVRYTLTLHHLERFVTPGQRWLDISSDPWFWLLAHQRFPQTLMTPTAMGEEVIVFRRQTDGEECEYRAVPMEIGQETMEFPIGSDHDLVTAFELLEHLQYHPASFLTGVNNALRPGGRFLLTTPNIASWSVIYRLLSGHAPYQTAQYGGPMDHRKEYTTYEVQRLLISAGFRVDCIKTFNCYLSDRLGLLSLPLYIGMLGWHAATLQTVPVRNLLVRGGSTMLVAATKVADCDPSQVIEV